MSRLAEQIKQAVAAFEECKTPPALIGGVALAAHRVVRATRDVDFLVDADDADRIHAALTTLDYQCRHRSADAANYVRGDEGLDLIYARRSKSRQLLREATERDTALGRLRVVSVEGLIGLKLQALVNNPSRESDRDDILALLRTHRNQLNLDALREYFALFDREELLNDWPPKQRPRKSDLDPYPLVGPAVPKTSLPGRTDLSDWLDLMETIETLCPQWPARPAEKYGQFKL